MNAVNKPTRGLRAARRAMDLLNATGDTKYAFEVMQALGRDTAPIGYARMLTTPQGERIAQDRVELTTKFGDAAWLANFAPGTVGAAYRDFIARNNVSAAGLAEAGERADVVERPFEHPHAWYARRTRDVHDVWHVLTGYETDGLGEGCLVAFSYAQTGSLGYVFIAYDVARSAKRNHPDLPVFQAIWRAYLAGRRAAWLPGEDYERLFAEPLESARKRLNISPPETYRRILQAFQPAMVAA